MKLHRRKRQIMLSNQNKSVGECYRRLLSDMRCKLFYGLHQPVITSSMRSSLPRKVRARGDNLLLESLGGNIELDLISLLNPGLTDPRGSE